LVQHRLDLTGIRPVQPEIRKQHNHVGLVVAERTALACRVCPHSATIAPARCTQAHSLRPRHQCRVDGAAKRRGLILPVVGNRWCSLRHW
jgi:hypothetical protein